MINNEIALETLKSSLRPRLREYLESKDIHISKNGMIQCLNPQHNDKNASMKILSDLNDEQVWCYGCQATGDIFTAHFWIDKAPLTGIEFIKDNIFKLASKFDIPFSDLNLSQEQIDRLEQFRFNSIVAERLIAKDERGKPVNWTHDLCEARGWPSRTCEKLAISTIQNYNKFIRDIQTSTGLTAKQIEEKGVTTELFGPDIITITLFDERNRIVGFTARNTKWIKGSDFPKYKNSSHSPTFQKGKILYGMNFVRNAKGRRLDIFEGNGSFISAFAAGHNSCVALCGSSITDDQVDLIISMGFTHINLVLDIDETGKEKTDLYMQRLSGIEGLRVECTRLVFKEKDNTLKDPDDFISTYGISEFFKLKPTSAFDWYLEKEAEAVMNNQISPVDFCKKMVKVIYNTADRIDRAKQRQKLSDLTGIPERDIEAEMERQVRVSVNEVKTQLSKKLVTAKSVDDIVNAMESIKDSMAESLDYKETLKTISLDESLKSFDDMITILENKKPGLQGWKTNFPLLDTGLSGIPKPIGVNERGETIKIPGSIFGIAGAPQHGKSTILQNITFNVALHNKDVSVLYWCLDDSRQRVLERLIAIHSKIEWKKITRRLPINTTEKQKVDESVKEIRKLLEEGRFVMKDRANGPSLSFLFKWVESMQEQYDRPVLVVIDSFHKVVGDSSNSEYARIKKLCEELKTFVQKYCVTVMASLELNKGRNRGTEPDLISINETGKIEYDFDIIATVFNHYYDTNGDQQFTIKKPTGQLMPLIKFNLRKSKDGGDGPVYFALDRDNFSISEYGEEDIARLTNQEEVKPIVTKDVRIISNDTGKLAPKRYSKEADTREPWHRH